jgi:acetylornithine deacetylase/succinyl-diaminopimelate desuccinylase-like protein
MPSIQPKIGANNIMTGTRQGAIDSALQYLENGSFEAELAKRVSYRTESQKTDSLPELHRYLDEEIIPAFEEMGFSCRKFDNPTGIAGPFLLAELIEGDDLSTVLGYGHGDVIIGLEEQWTKGEGPWITSRDGDYLYGRGTADNKAQHTINMAALRTVLRERGSLGFNAKFLIEMGEEAGSLGLREVLEKNRDAFQADVFIGSDGPRVSPNLPTLTLGARGAENFDLIVDLREGSHHSGNWGGLIADPATILSHAIACIVGPTGQIKIKDWLPPPTPASVKTALKGLEIEAGPGAPAIDPNWGEPGLTPAERVYSWNSFAVLAMKTGNPDKPVNAIPPRAWAHCQLRYFAGTDETKILTSLRQHLDENGFDMVKLSEPPKANAAGFGASRTEPDHPWVEHVRQSMQRTLGKPPAVIPSMGGSICNDLFTDLLGLPAIWIPHSYAACSQHAPNEHVLMSVCHSALQVMTGIYWDIGEFDQHSN